MILHKWILFLGFFLVIIPNTAYSMQDEECPYDTIKNMDRLSTLKIENYKGNFHNSLPLSLLLNEFRSLQFVSLMHVKGISSLNLILPNLENLCVSDSINDITLINTHSLCKIYASPLVNIHVFGAFHLHSAGMFSTVSHIKIPDWTDESLKKMICLFYAQKAQIHVSAENKIRDERTKSLESFFSDTLTTSYMNSPQTFEASTHKRVAREILKHVYDNFVKENQEKYTESFYQTILINRNFQMQQQSPT